MMVLSVKARVRDAEEKDLRQIAELYRVEYGKEPYNERWTRLSSEGKIRRYFANHKILVLEIDHNVFGVIIGRMSIGESGKKGFVSEFIVAGDYQGKGYGRLLYNKLEDYFLKNNAKNIELMTNRKAKAFKIYSKLGFKELKEFAYFVKTID